MKRSRVAVDYPLWDRLRKLDKVAARRFPTDYDRGFGGLGLILHPRPLRYGYLSTPKNALTFATTGGDGVHFSFVVLDGRVTEETPIVITIPEVHANFIGGENLFDFLCLGFHRGYFALEELPPVHKGLDKTLAVYSSPSWQPKDDSDWAVGYGVNQHQRKVLDFLIGELGLKPWKDMKRKFKRLQRKYLPLLILPQWLA